MLGALEMVNGLRNCFAFSQTFHFSYNSQEILLIINGWQNKVTRTAGNLALTQRLTAKVLRCTYYPLAMYLTWFLNKCHEMMLRHFLHFISQKKDEKERFKNVCIIFYHHI